MTALGVAVHEVVVQQGEVVDELDRDRAGQPDLDRGTGRLRGQQCQCRTYQLAAAARQRRALRVGPAAVVGDHPAQPGMEPVDSGA